MNILGAERSVLFDTVVLNGSVMYGSKIVLLGADRLGTPHTNMLQSGQLGTPKEFDFAGIRVETDNKDLLIEETLRWGRHELFNSLGLEFAWTSCFKTPFRWPLSALPRSPLTSKPIPTKHYLPISALPLRIRSNEEFEARWVSLYDSYVAETNMTIQAKKTEQETSGKSKPLACYPVTLRVVLEGVLFS